MEEVVSYPHFHLRKDILCEQSVKYLNMSAYVLVIISKTIHGTSRTLNVEFSESGD